MFITGNLREYPREPFFKPLMYFTSVLNMRELKRIHDTAVSVDISNGGLGMIANHPLREGHVLTFEDEIKINGITAKFAIVRWTAKINGNKYRIGAKFV